MSNERIEHEGVVVGDTEGVLRVSLSVGSACGSCRAAKLCNSSEAQEKVVEARRDVGCHAAIGGRVRVVGEARLGMQAVGLAYGVPLLLLVAGVVLGKTLLGSDAAGGLVALAALVPWYMALYLCRSRLRRNFSFTAQDLPQEADE